MTDTLLYSTTIPALIPGASEIVEFSFVLPNDDAGSLSFIAQVDANNAISESNETNNINCQTSEVLACAKLVSTTVNPSGAGGVVVSAETELLTWVCTGICCGERAYNYGTTRDGLPFF